MKDFYNNDLDAMTQAIQMNITVSVVAVATIVVSVKSDLARLGPALHKPVYDVASLLQSDAIDEWTCNGKSTVCTDK